MNSALPGRKGLTAPTVEPGKGSASFFVRCSEPQFGIPRGEHYAGPIARAILIV